MRKALCCFVALASCRTPAPTTQPSTQEAVITERATADRLADTKELPTGINATAKIGDYRLFNRDVEVIIDSLDGKQGFAASGGNVIDARTRPRGVDALNQTFLYLDDTFPRQAYWRSLVIDPPGKDGSASITVEGDDTNASTIHARTTYRLAPRGAVLTLQTTVTNTGSASVEGYELGDCLQWGKTEHFAPGTGYEMHGKKLKLPWVVGIGDGVSYGMFSAASEMASFSGASWTDVIHKTVTLGPGESASYERYFVVGLGDTTSVLQTYSTHAPPGAPPLQLGRVHGRVSQTNGESVLHAELTFFKDGQPFATTKCTANGLYDATLPTGDYEVEVLGPGLRSKEKERLHVGLDGSKSFLVESGGRIRFFIREVTPQKRVGIPAKLSVYGMDGLPNPIFGKPFQAAGAMNVALSLDGAGEVRLPAGKYKLYASRGLEYDLGEAEISVASNQRYDVTFDIRRVIDTTGYISADFHQHQRNSFDSAMSLEDRALTNLAEGLELIVPTDHDFATDYTPVLKAMGIADKLLTVSGVEATTHTLGHFAAFPFAPTPNAPRAGAPDTWNKKVKDIFADLRAEATDKVIQVNHPRDDSTGYFHLQHLDTTSGTSADPDFAWDFDAIELLNGKRVKDAEKVVLDWMNLLATGKRVTATGNSDSHNVVFQEVGYPRNFIRMGDFSPQALVDAVKTRHAIVATNGPFIELFAGEASAPAQVGDTLVVKKPGEVIVRYKVQAAPWVDVTSLELWQDGKKIHTQAIPPAKTPLRAEGMHRITVTKTSYVFAIARGTKPLEPVLPTYRNRPALPFGFTNPIYFELQAAGSKK